ncbi:hypothetical protein ACWDYH_05430 [Nocardia goodfellowii]|uniref:Uncharacterized protein n=1 Tax=Nocardia goodfellowii TaxID=882446 RepID=A0ABS4Q9Y4_9NOCA|nr:hypothetical protein [Nocardia goodfellowii]MBP2188496.1 hypothetical protein [Nocardia goodfellowii]
MSTEDGHAPGLFSHETAPLTAFPMADEGAPHHRPVFSADESAAAQDPAGRAGD